MPGCFSFLPSPPHSLFKRKSKTKSTSPPSAADDAASTSVPKTYDEKAGTMSQDTPAKKFGYLPCQCAGEPSGPQDPWLFGDADPSPPYHDDGTANAELPADLYRPEVLRTIQDEIRARDGELRELSMQIHEHPELMFEEKYAHDTLSAFMEARGFAVTRHYLSLETAWRASFEYRSKSSTSSSDEKVRTIGLNSEMDALPGIGHACGHNLIAIAGVGAALGIKRALEVHDISANIVLLGTPAEEGGHGKVVLIERGAYEGMDACLMAHPGAGPKKTAGTGPCRAISSFTVEYHGHTAHASAAPWEGQNALDAAFLAYAAVSALRQQIHPSMRVHGIVEGRDWAANIIPDYAKMTWIVRAPTWDDTLALRERVVNCIRAASLATATRAEVTWGGYTFDLRQNDVLAGNFAAVVGTYGIETHKSIEGAIGGSTDFGNVTYAVPSIHPSYSIPTAPNGGNHTALFTQAAATPEAHAITLRIATALAHTGVRVVDDAAFAGEVRRRWEETVPRVLQAA